MKPLCVIGEFSQNYLYILDILIVYSPNNYDFK